MVSLINGETIVFKFALIILNNSIICSKIKWIMDNRNSGKRILIVHNRYQVRGGEDSVVENEVNMLKEHGNHVFEYFRDNSEVENMGLFHKCLVPINSVFNIRTYNEIKRSISENEIDLVHVHNTHFLISPSLFFAARACRVPVVMTVHNFRLTCVSAMLYRDGKVCEDCVGHGVWNGITHKCYRDSRLHSFILATSIIANRMIGTYRNVYFICLSQFNKDKLLNIRGIKENKVFIKPNFAKPLVQREESYAIEKDIYMFFGRIDKTKGIELIISAFSRLPEKKIVIAGVGPLFERCKREILDNGITNVQMIGWCDKSTLGQYLSRTKAVVCASQWYEGHPMTVVEAFASGVPVITGNIGNIGAAVTDGYNGVKYKFDSSEALCEAIERFENMDYTCLSQNAYSTYKELYTEECNYNMLMDIYEKMTNVR